MVQEATLWVLTNYKSLWLCSRHSHQGQLSVASCSLWIHAAWDAPPPPASDAQGGTTKSKGQIKLIRIWMMDCIEGVWSWVRSFEGMEGGQADISHWEDGNVLVQGSSLGWDSRKWTYFQGEEAGNQRQAEWTGTQSKGRKGAWHCREMLNRADLCGIHTQSMFSESKGQKGCGPSGSTAHQQLPNSLSDLQQNAG